MYAKGVFVFCAQLLLAKAIFGQCIGNSGLLLQNNAGGISSFGNLGAAPCAGNLANANILSNQNLFATASQPILDNLSYGGVLSVSSGSPLSPNGISISSDNLLLEGAVGVNGNIPLAGAVVIDGNVQSGGQAAIQYSTLPGSGLNSAGCGAGLAGGNFAGNNLGLGVGNLGGYGQNLGGLNGLNLVNNRPCLA